MRPRRAHHLRRLSVERCRARRRGPVGDAAPCRRRLCPPVYPQGGAVGRIAAVPGLFPQDRLTMPSGGVGAPYSIEIFQGAGAARGDQPSAARGNQLAIMTMVYNEAINLPIWLRHYRRMAPGATL